jgi:hypothetical protein
VDADPTRRFRPVLRVLAPCLLSGPVAAALVTAQATLLVHLLVGAFAARADLATLTGPFALLSVVVAARAGVAAASEWTGGRAAALDPHTGHHLPRVVLAAAVTAAAAARVLLDDWPAALAVGLVLSVVPLWVVVRPGTRTLRQRLGVVAALSVGLVVVSTGVRTLVGMDLRTALLAAVLVPEVCLSWRRVGPAFRAAADGRAAVGRADVSPTRTP